LHILFILNGEAALVSPVPQKRIHSLPAALWWLCAACLAVTVFSWIFASVYYRHTGGLESASLWSHDPSDAFTDFSHYAFLFPSFHTAAFFLSDDRFAYPAPAAVLFNGLYHMGPCQLFIWLGCILGGALAAAALFYRELVRNGVAATQSALFVACLTLTSWPLLFLYERANIEIVIWLLAALGVWALLRRHPLLAAMLFGVAASIKLYPIVLLALLLSRKHAHAFLAGVATFLLAMLGSFYYVGPTIAIAWHGTVNGISGFVSNYAATAHSELATDHSFLACIKQFASNPPFHHTDFSACSRCYVVIALSGAALLFLLRVRRLPLLNQILFVMICMVALPPVSYDYTLVHLYVPFALFVLACIRSAQARDGLPDADTPGFKRALLCFGLLFTPQFFLLHRTLNLNGALKSMALAGLLLLLSRHPIHDPDLLTPQRHKAATEAAYA
jgi:hypothetical protein